jgi:hypothetical protein
MVIDHSKISKILSGYDPRLKNDEPLLNNKDLIFIKYAPVMSCDVKLSFSCYKMTVRDT